MDLHRRVCIHIIHFIKLITANEARDTNMSRVQIIDADNPVENSTQNEHSYLKKNIKICSQ